MLNIISEGQNYFSMPKIELSTHQIQQLKKGHIMLIADVNLELIVKFHRWLKKGHTKKHPQTKNHAR